MGRRKAFSLALRLKVLNGSRNLNEEVNSLNNDKDKFQLSYYKLTLVTKYLSNCSFISVT